MVVSFGVAVVEPGLEHIRGESGLAIADVLNPTSRVSETTAAASDRILILTSSERRANTTTERLLQDSKKR